MNIPFLLKKNDKNLVINKDFKLTKQGVQGIKYIGLENKFFTLFPKVKTLLEFKNWHETWNFRSNNKASGFKLVNLGKASVEVISEVLAKDGSVLAEVKAEVLNGQLVEIMYPDVSNIAQDCDLKLSVKQKKIGFGKLALLNFKCIDHAKKIKNLLGPGVEIGPGHNRRVKHDEVKYLEKYSLDTWTEANKVGSETVLDFSKYVIGPADQIPVTDDSLEFIFSSHVFEHLNNPIGHLKHWGSKLKTGGKVACVVPCIYGTKDYCAEPSSMEQFISEDKNSAFEIPLEKYQYYNDIRGWNLGGERLKDEDRSIHVHFYEQDNISELLEYAVKKLGFSNYSIDYDKNHKDFYFELVK